MSSDIGLAERILEDHLTCKICFGAFIEPKALPCLHTFCAGCLRDYVTSRAFDVQRHFPCPMCRANVIIPNEGISGFPNNHLVASLSETVTSNRDHDDDSSKISHTGKTNSLCVLPPRERRYSDNDIMHRLNDGNLCPSSGILSHSSSDISGRANTVPSQIIYPDISQNSDNITSMVMVSNQSDTISVTDLERQFGKYGPGLTDFLKPKGLAVTKNGEIIVTDMAGNRVMIFTGEGAFVKKFTDDCTVHDVGVTPKGTILMAVHSSKSSVILKEYTFNGKLVGSFGSNFRFDNPSGLSVARDGSIAVTSIENNQVYVFNADKKLQRRFGKRGVGDDGFMSPYHVTTNGKGDVIVSDCGNDAVKVYGKLGNFRHKFGGFGDAPGKLRKPLGVAADDSDNVYVADSDNHRVQVFSPKGRLLVVAVSETDRIQPGVKPTNVALSSSGKLLVLLSGESFAQIHIYSSLALPASTNDPESCVTC